MTADMDVILSKLNTVLPAGRVSREPAELEKFGGLSQLMFDGRLPSCILYPANVDELQAVIRLANEADINLTVSSSTGVHRHGGSSSSQGNVLVDLSAWRTIDLIERRNRVCRIEPGVSYGQLTAALSEAGLTLPMPLAPRAGKSVLAAIMDRTPSTWPNKQWDSGDPAASTEFFFGNGERFRSGAAGGPGSIEQQRRSGGAQKHPSGPSQTDFHRVIQGSQGTMGVVSWITLRTELKPSVEKRLLVGSERLDELLPFIYAVQRGLLGEQNFILDRTAVALLLSNGDRDVFREIYAACPRWICLQNVAGFERLPEERLAYHLGDIGGLAKMSGLSLEERIGPIAATELLGRAIHPCGDIDWRDMLRGNSLSIFFLSTLDRVPSFVTVVREMAERHGIGEGESGIYVQPIVQNHACHVEIVLPFDGRTETETMRMRRFERRLVIRLMEAGAFFSRPYGSAAELVWDQNPANFQLVKSIKGIFDPKRVLQRGKWRL